jgi:glyoxylase-like metal-dependent hydrolase (beta-lactamase superfamily II)/uncharacterized membrane protein YedE/YeeE
MKIAINLAVGLIFGLGLIVSGMTNPAKVLNFLDLAGAWDPSLAFVMGGAMLVTMAGYRFAFMRPRPVLDTRYHLPTLTQIDMPLIAGSVLFGIGWGLGGFCPGPALTALPLGAPGTLAFVPAMLAGIAAARWWTSVTVSAGNAKAAFQNSVTENKEHVMSTSQITVDLSIKPDVEGFFDADTNTISYVVKDPASNACAIIDSVMDIDYAAGRISYAAADKLIAYVQSNGLKVEWLIETHAHADHLSGAPYIQGKLGGKIGIGENIKIVQDVFGKIFNEGTQFQRDGSQFDRLFADDDSYQVGTMTVRVMATPGHTPACMTHIAGNAAFVGDTLFMPDGGTARADFPGGDARVLYRSIKKLLSLPSEIRLFMCHDYAPGGRAIKWETTVADERAHNIHVHDGISEDEFVAMRAARDETLGMPKLIVPSIQVNIRAGHLPEPDESGKRFLKVPLNGL